jgi:hypothetical protein
MHGFPARTPAWLLTPGAPFWRGKGGASPWQRYTWQSREDRQREACAELLAGLARGDSPTGRTERARKERDHGAGGVISRGGAKAHPQQEGGEAWNETSETSSSSKDLPAPPGEREVCRVGRLE